MIAVFSNIITWNIIATLSILNSSALLFRQNISLETIIRTEVHLLEVSKSSSPLKCFLLFSTEFRLVLEGRFFTNLLQTGIPQRIHHDAVVLLEVVDQCITILDIGLCTILTPGVNGTIVFPKLVSVERIE